MSRKIQYSAIASINPGDITSSHLLDTTIVNADVSASAAIAYSKLSLAGAIVNADISASAAIAGSKLQALSVGANAGVIPSTGVADAHVSATAAVAGSKLQALSVGANAGVIPSTGVADAHVSATAAIAYSKLSLGGSIVNADISASAAIAYSKLSLAGAIVNADISASAAIVDTKLATIATAGKVDGAALTGFANIPAGAGQIPSANLNNAVDKTVFVFPGNGYLNGATVAFGHDNAVIQFANNADQDWSLMVRVPKGATAISSIKLRVTGLNSGNVLLKFFTAVTDITDIADSIKDETDTFTAYTISQINGWWESLTVPAAAYNGLTDIEQDDVVRLRIYRNGANASDTYEAIFEVQAVIFTFT